MKFGLKRENRSGRGGSGLVSAVILAAGSSSRMGGMDKLSASLAGSTVIAHTIRAFQASEDVGEIVLVLRKGAEKPALAGASGCDKLSRIVHGGDTRTDSSYAGVMACDPKAEIILIHDGARPLVTGEVIKNAVEGARKFGAAVPVTPVTDTIKVDESNPTFKMMEEGASTLQKEESSRHAQRQLDFIRKLQAALVRIENKTYGVCRITGQLIPKERLRAVPHATLSIEGKEIEAQRKKQG